MLLTLALALSSIQEPAVLPDVLLVGDSISIGYTPVVQRLLAGEARVVRPMKDGKGPENCQYTAYGLERLDAWLGHTVWEVIHFNFGLHDLKYVDDDFPKPPIVQERGEAILANPRAYQLGPLDEYEANLERLFVRLKATGAELVCTTTTPVPEGAKGRIPGDAERYNEVARRLAERHGVMLDDLHEFLHDLRAPNPTLDDVQNDADVHFNKAGSELLGKRVVASIRAALKRDTDTLDLAAWVQPLPQTAIFSTAVEATLKDATANEGAWFDPERERHYAIVSTEKRLVLSTSVDGVFWTTARHRAVVTSPLRMTKGGFAVDRFGESRLYRDPVTGVPQALVVAAEHGNKASYLRIRLAPPVDREALLGLDYDAFDQTPGSGWRLLAERQDHVGAATLLDTYRKRHPGSRNETILFFHAGQMYGFAGEVELAIQRFENSLQDERPDSPIRWNAYVEATIAFLTGNEAMLRAKREEIASGPGQGGFIPNLNVVDSFIRNFGSSYAKAYRGE